MTTSLGQKEKIAMQFTAHYLIAPNEHLKSLAVADEDIASLLCDTFLVQSKESSGSKDDYVLRTKLFVLLHFAREYLQVPSVAELFEGAQFTEELFDKWWTIAASEDIEVMPSFGDKYKVEGVSRSRVPSTTSTAVNDWLARVIEFHP